MSKLPDFTSTEAITRFLRNKTTTPDQIYEVSSKLLSDDQNQIKIALPEKEKFILELICDRFSQRQYELFKVNGSMWNLLNQVWLKLSVSKMLRQTKDRIVCNVKWNDIIGSTLQEIVDDDELQSNEVLIEYLAAVLQLTLNEHKINNSNEQSITMIENLLELAISLSPSSSESTEATSRIISRLSSTIVSVYRLNNTKVTTYTKKQVTQFYVSCLPNLLQLIRLPSSTDALKDTVLYDILLSKTNIEEVEENLQFFIKKRNIQLIPSDSINSMFKLLIPKLSIGKLESIFKIVVEKFPQSTAPLLKELKTKARLSSCYSGHVEEL
ncbi:unnamed protein product [Ambrosiozyma monospora]|uniref:Unnamed protein product n=1 Tax=Ambrosiozyma monospora TaxID=43982 RepID=A0ACB5TB60_AMBMO|nr:unnamed protein product [Ambrosiozyma monospora]